VLVNNEDIPIATSKQALLGFKRNKLNIELTDFTKLSRVLASNQGFYNNFHIKNAQGSYKLKESNFWPIKRQEDSVLD
jgi:hypothetical protein